MTPRRLGLFLALATLPVTGPKAAHAQGQINVQPAPVFQNEGRDPIPFNVTLSSLTLTVIVSSDTIVRSTYFQSVSSNTTSICISPSSGSTNCTTSWAGWQLSPNSSMIQYTRSAWYGRLPSGAPAQAVSGFRTRDRGDYGTISSPAR